MTGDRPSPVVRAASASSGTSRSPQNASSSLMLIRPSARRRQAAWHRVRTYRTPQRGPSRCASASHVAGDGPGGLRLRAARNRDENANASNISSSHCFCTAEFTVLAPHVAACRAPCNSHPTGPPACQRRNGSCGARSAHVRAGDAYTDAAVVLPLQMNQCRCTAESARLCPCASAPMANKSIHSSIESSRRCAMSRAGPGSSRRECARRWQIPCRYSFEDVRGPAATL